MNFNPMQRRQLRLTAGMSGALLRAAQTVALAAVALPAMASREVETLGVVPEILRWLAGAIVQVLLLYALLAIVLTPLLIWFVRRAGAGSSQSRYRTPTVISLRESGESGSPSADEARDAQQRHAQLRAQAEAIELRPQVRSTSDVDDETRKRIAAAAKRLDTRAETRAKPSDTDS